MASASGLCEISAYQTPSAGSFDVGAACSMGLGYPRMQTGGIGEVADRGRLGTPATTANVLEKR